MENRKQATNEIERRAYANGVEVRATEKGATLRGYAARFGSVYDMGWFTEEVGRDAFKNADMSDVRILFNHDPNQILGRTKNGTARVGVDNEGLWYEVDLPASAENVREAVERGDIDQSSWGFYLKKDSWTKRDGSDKQHRVLEQVEVVFDASPVTFPANPDTTVAKRSLEAYQKESVPTETKDNGADTQTEIELIVALLERRLDYLNLTA